ncbi:MAG TPA: DUF1801 domain-containing protein [Candidatus Saccharimonadales bacterium]|jgi:hypothetical protein
MQEDIQMYHNKQTSEDERICQQLYEIISKNLPQATAKVWHAHPVWFIDGNPIVGYSKLKGDVRMMFWSGQSFDEPGLISTGSFKAAEIRYTDAKQIEHADLKRYLHKAVQIQWDYKHIMKNRGLLKLR